MRDGHTERLEETSKSRKIFRPKMEEVRGRLRKLHIEELYDLHSSTNINKGNT